MQNNRVSIPTMSSIFARIANPAGRIDYFAAVGERATRLTNRLYPAKPVAHGFYDPAGFIASCQYGATRNRFYKETFHRLVAREEARGRGFAG